MRTKWEKSGWNKTINTWKKKTVTDNGKEIKIKNNLKN